MDVSLRTKYMGLDLPGPLIAAASPLSRKLDNIRQMEDAGAGAVVLYSLFEEEIRQEMAQFDFLEETTAEQSSGVLKDLPGMVRFPAGVDRYLNLIRNAREAVDIPVIASLNGMTNAGWITYAQQMEDAGADALELNIFFIPADPRLDSTDIERQYCDILRSVRTSVDIPIALKMSPYFSAPAHFARALDKLGADALVLFNRFYEPDLDIEEQKILHTLDLSSPSEKRLPLLWIAILYGKLRCDLAATTGVWTSADIIKYLMAGADVVMTASALIEKGIGHIRKMQQDLVHWLEIHEISDVNAIRGVMGKNHVQDPTAFERANYIKILERFSKSRA